MQCQQIPDTSWPHMSRKPKYVQVCTAKERAPVVRKSTEEEIAATFSARSK